MSYIITHHRRDGTVHRQYVPTSDGNNPNNREEEIQGQASTIRKNLRNKMGWDKKKLFRHVAAIPVEVREFVRRNDGIEASRDVKHLIRTAEELGLNVRTGRGRI